MSEDLGFAVLSATPLPLIVTTRDTKVVFGNTAAARLLGRPAAALAGSWLAEHVRSPHGRVRRLATVAAGAPHPVTAEVELKVGRRNQLKIMVVVAGLDRDRRSGDGAVLLWQFATAPSAHVLPESPSESGPDRRDVRADPLSAPDDELDDGVALVGEDVGTATLATLGSLVQPAGTDGPDVDDVGRRAAAALARAAGVPHVRLAADPGSHRGPVMAASDEVAALVGQVEALVAGGPSELAAQGGRVLVPALDDDPRWPTLGRRLVDDFGVRSLAALPLSLGAGLRGAVVVYGDDPGAATSRATAVQHVVGVVEVVLAGAVRETAAREESVQLREAMASRAVIEQAKGALMARHAVDAEEAFQLLRRESMVRNERLRDVAAALVESLPSGAPQVSGS